MASRSDRRLVLASAVMSVSLLGACLGRAEPTPVSAVDQGYVPTAVAMALAAAEAHRQASQPTSTDTPTPLPSATPTKVPSAATATTATTPTTPTPAPRPAGVVIADGLRVRAGPGAAYGILGVLYEGHEVAINGQEPGGGWLLVTTPDGRAGWVFAEYVSVSVPLSSLPVITDIPPEPQPTPTTGEPSD